LPAVVDNAGNVWVADTLLSSVVELTVSNGAVQSSASYTAGGISGPIGIAIEHWRPHRSPAAASICPPPSPSTVRASPGIYCSLMLLERESFPIPKQIKSIAKGME
jgi:hypothetical protein